jgi:hypothetical protein
MADACASLLVIVRFYSGGTFNPTTISANKKAMYQLRVVRSFLGGLAAQGVVMRGTTQLGRRVTHQAIERMASMMGYAVARKGCCLAALEGG